MVDNRPVQEAPTLTGPLSTAWSAHLDTSAVEAPSLNAAPENGRSPAKPPALATTTAPTRTTDRRGLSLRTARPAITQTGSRSASAARLEMSAPMARLRAAAAELTAQPAPHLSKAARTTKTATLGRTTAPMARESQPLAPARLAKRTPSVS